MIQILDGSSEKFGYFFVNLIFKMAATSATKILT
jgi:hypothetical protein